MSNDPKDPPQAPQDLFPFDEMSTGETSSLLRRANSITGAPQSNLAQPDPALKPMTGAQLAFRPSAPPRQAQKPTTSTQPAFKPGTGTHPALKSTTGVQPAFTPTSGSNPALKRSGTGTNTFAAFKPLPESAPREVEIDEDEGPPVFDPERLQAQIRAMSMNDSALGRAAKSTAKPNKAPSSSANDTFVKTKMKQAEAKVVDFDLDEDLG